MRKILLIIITMLLVAGCSFIEKRGRSLQDRRVARIGHEVLYESDIVRMMPDGVSSADSAAMVSRYINTWALDRLLLLKQRSNSLKLSAMSLLKWKSFVALCSVSDLKSAGLRRGLTQQ